MATDYWNVPLGDLETIQSNLHSMSDDLDGVEGSASSVLGTDEIHGHLIESAVEDFFNDWKASRRMLIENIDKLGTVTGEIAKAVRTFDTDLAGGLNEFAAALRGEGQ